MWYKLTGMTFCGLHLFIRSLPHHPPNRFLFVLSIFNNCFYHVTYVKNHTCSFASFLLGFYSCNGNLYSWVQHPPNPSCFLFCSPNGFLLVHTLQNWFLLSNIFYLFFKIITLMMPRNICRYTFSKFVYVKL